MYASTTQARKLLKLAFASCNATVPSHTYTEKTTDYERNRRSIVFPVYGDALAEQIANEATKLFKEFKLYESRVRVTHSLYSGASYIRVIAYVDSLVG